MSPDRIAGRAPKSYAYRVGDRLDEDAIGARIRAALAGQPGSSSASLGPAAAVVWEDAGDEVLVHLDSLQVRLPERMVVISVDLESDQTGRGPVIVRFVFGSTEDALGMVAATDELAHGNPELATRWGDVVRDVAWAALIGTVEEHARERGLAPQAIHFVRGNIRLRTTSDVPLSDRVTPTKGSAPGANGSENAIPKPRRSGSRTKRTSR